MTLLTRRIDYQNLLLLLMMLMLWDPADADAYAYAHAHAHAHAHAEVAVVQVRGRPGVVVRVAPSGVVVRVWSSGWLRVAPGGSGWLRVAPGCGSRGWLEKDNNKPLLQTRCALQYTRTLTADWVALERSKRP